MEDAGNTLKFVILDACRDNPYAGLWQSSQQGLAVVNAARGAVIAYATDPGKTAADGMDRNSPYTKQLLRFIKQSNITHEQLFKQVRRAVMQETQSQQIPWETSSLLGEFYFVGENHGKDFPLPRQ
jgi:uncharacterized caspase-like protein